MNTEVPAAAAPTYEPMRALVDSYDWARTPLGPIDGWPQSLKTMVRFMLDSRYSMWMGWGPELTFLYNDAYARDTLAAKHPWALGRPAREVWAEIWTDIGPRIEGVLKSGKATWDQGLLLLLERNGYPEETYHSFSYSPLYGDDNAIAGMFCVVTEETERVLALGRVGALRDVAAVLATAKTASEVYASLAAGLDGRNLPFTLSFKAVGQELELVSRSGFAEGTFDPAMLRPESWPLSEARDHNASVVIDDLSKRFAQVPTGAWKRPPARAMLLPIVQPGTSHVDALMVAGLNPHRELDEGYRGFIDLVVGQVASALVRARAYEDERDRAESLAALDHAKTTFFSNVSHELRTPLTPMLGPLEDALREEPENGAAHERLAIAHRNGLRLLKLVNSLLDFSRIEAGRVQASFEPVDLARRTGELASVFRSAIERAGMRLTIDAPKLDQPVYVDGDMLEKIVLNLVSNAFKYTLEGEISVVLRRVGEHAELSVRDTGLGIPEHELPHLFQRFHRVEGVRGRTQEGTGIGLALVSELVGLHGGSIRVESVHGRGSTFTVCLQLGSAHLPADRIKASNDLPSTAVTAAAYVEEALRWLPDSADVRAASGATETAEMPGGLARTRGARVILADDNADMRAYVSRLLQPFWAVEAVGDGEAALDAARRERPDLVLSDVMMPKLDGFGLLQELRADSNLRGVPVILLSARAGEESRVEGMHAGADDYLVKPFASRELIARVGAHLELARVRREADLAIAEARRRSDTALLAGEVGTYYWDIPRERILGDRNFMRILGLDADQDGSIPVAMVLAAIHPDDRGKASSVIERTIADAAPFEVEYRILHRTSERWIIARGIVQHDSNGQPIGRAGVVVDITERKQAAQRLLEVERDARLEAERLGRMKDEFLATLSHELRTPLNAMLGWTQLLRHRVKPEQINEGLDVIERNAEASPRLDKLKVLVVDNDRDARDILRLMLEDCGAHVVTAENAEGALVMLRSMRPDLLLSDIGMPGVDGYELMRRVRQLSAHEGGRVPAVAITAFARSDDRRRALMAGYQMHLAKPVEPDELRAVCASLSRRG